MTRDWTPEEDAMLRWMTGLAGTWHLATHKRALAKAGFKRTVPEIRDRLRDMELLTTRATRRRTAT